MKFRQSCIVEMSEAQGVEGATLQLGKQVGVGSRARPLVRVLSGQQGARIEADGLVWQKAPSCRVALGDLRTCLLQEGCWLMMRPMMISCGVSCTHTLNFSRAFKVTKSIEKIVELLTIIA